MASCYNAWIDSGNVKDAVKTTNMVDSVLSHNPKELEALLLRLKLLRRNRKQTQQALEVTTQMIAFFPSFYPAYTERMYIMLELGTWDQALDCAQRAMSLNPDSIDALAVTVISDLCRGSSGSLGGIDEKRTSQLISSLFSCIQKCEPNDQQIALAVLRPIIRLSGRKAP